MYKFSESSKKKLESCHEDLQKLFYEVIKVHDCTIIDGYRDKKRQDFLFETKKSQVKWPHGKHNSKPSRAVDVAPYPIDWENKESFYFFAGLVKGIAYKLGIKIRLGADWDVDNDLKDQTFFDLVHFELK